MEFVSYVESTKSKKHRSGKPRTFILAVENGKIKGQTWKVNPSIDDVLDFVNGFRFRSNVETIEDHLL